jgi:hypothetical protein
VEWLVASIVLSIVLTVVLNVLLRVFPDAGARAARRLDDLAASDGNRGSGGRTRVYVPWKAMIVVSLLATLALNVVLWTR